MGLTYTESAALMIDTEFRGRVKVGCLHYAAYILGEAPSTPAHNVRTKWAQGAMLNPEGTAVQVQPGVVMQPAVQEQGAAISDEDLQTAVEDTINSIM